MKLYIDWLELKIKGCDELEGMEREKAIYQNVLKQVRSFTPIPEAIEPSPEEIEEFIDDKTKMLDLQRQSSRHYVRSGIEFMQQHTQTEKGCPFDDPNNFNPDLPTQRYHLNCHKCGATYWSADAFPKPQLCYGCTALTDPAPPSTLDDITVFVKIEYDGLNTSVWIDDIKRDMDFLNRFLKSRSLTEREEWISIVRNKRLVQKLGQCYRIDNMSRLVIATLCDDYLDKSGQLLGEVRDYARNEKE